MTNIIQQSSYIPSFSFLTKLYHRTDGNPEKALQYWLERGNNDYEKEREGTVFEEAIFMDDQEFAKKYRVVSTSFPGENTSSYAFLKSFAECENILQAKEESGIRLKESTLIEKLENGWGECLQAIKGEFSPISQKEWDSAMRIREKGRNHWLYTLQLGGEFEYQKEIRGSYEFEYEGSMVRQEYKGFSDVVKHGDIVVEMKTTDRLSKFYPQGKSALNHAQCAMYGDAEKCSVYCFFVVENKAPFSMNVFWLEDEQLQEGRDFYQNMLEIFYRVNTENLWHKGDEFYYPTGRQFVFEK